jgi:hypothetical protein
MQVRGSDGALPSIVCGLPLGAGRGLFQPMSTITEIEAAADQLPHAEKLRLMETLWGELSRREAGYESPAWHADALAETERRVAEGREEVLDWNRTKAELRDKKA